MSGFQYDVVYLSAVIDSCGSINSRDSARDVAIKLADAIYCTQAFHRRRRSTIASFDVAYLPRSSSKYPSPEPSLAGGWGWLFPTFQALRKNRGLCLT
jgi:hypothetical protein